VLGFLDGVADADRFCFYYKQRLILVSFKFLLLLSKSQNNKKKSMQKVASVA